MTAPQNGKVAVERKDNCVIVTILCVDHYAAMLLYDDIANNLTGGLSIEFENVKEET